MDSKAGCYLGPLVSRPLGGVGLGGQGFQCLGVHFGPCSPDCFHHAQPTPLPPPGASATAGSGSAPLRRVLCRHWGQRGLVHSQRRGHGLQRRGIRADHAKRARHSADDVRHPAAAQPDQPGQQGGSRERGGAGLPALLASRGLAAPATASLQATCTTALLLRCCRAWEKRTSFAACLRMRPTSATATSIATPTHPCLRGEAAPASELVPPPPHTPALSPPNSSPSPRPTCHAGKWCMANFPSPR